MEYTLTERGAPRLFEGPNLGQGDGVMSAPLILQALDAKDMKDRIRMVLSDGRFHVDSFVEYTSLDVGTKLDRGDVVKVETWSLKVIRGRTVAHIHSMQRIGKCNMVGTPVHFVSGSMQQEQPTQMVPGPEQQAPMAAGSFAAAQAAVSELSTPVRPISQNTSQISPTPPNRANPNSLINRFQNVGAAPGPVMPIKELSQYSGRWTIKGRVTSKSDVRKFQNSRGEGQLFSIEILDSAGGEIRGTFFGKAVDKYLDLVQPKGVYTFSKGSVKPAKKQYSRCDHDFEITFDERSEVIPAEDASIPQMTWNFTSLSALNAQGPPNSTVDVAAIVIALREPAIIQTRFGERSKGAMTIADDSGKTVEVSLWGDHANNPNIREGEVVLMKAFKISEWEGRTQLSSGFGSCIETNPDHQRAFQLLGWYQQHRHEIQTVAPRSGGGPSAVKKTIEAIREEDVNLGVGNMDPFAPGAPRSVHYHNLARATITHLPMDRPPFYRACPEKVPGFNGEGDMRHCAKKVEMVGENSWHCANGHQSMQPMVRWQMNAINLCDATGELRLDVLGDDGNRLFGCQADQIAQIWERQSEDPTAARSLEDFVSKVQFKRLNFRLRSKKEFWNDQEKTKVMLVECNPISVAAEAKELLSEVRQTLGF